MNNITFPCYCWVDVGNGPALMLLVHVSHITMSNWLFQEYLLPQYMNKFITINLVIHANGLTEKKGVQFLHTCVCHFRKACVELSK